MESRREEKRRSEEEEKVEKGREREEETESVSGAPLPSFLSHSTLSMRELFLV